MDQFGANSDQHNLNEQQQPVDGMTWWFRWLIKGAAVILGFIAVILGIVTAISLSISCIIGGLVLVFSGVLVLALEVPICCSFIEFIKPITQFSEGRPHWQKCVVYMGPPIVVIILCPSAAAILGSLCVFGVAALYFMLTVGKKASLDEMRFRANTTDNKNTLNSNELP